MLGDAAGLSSHLTSGWFCLHEEGATDVGIAGPRVWKGAHHQINAPLKYT